MKEKKDINKKIELMKNNLKELDKFIKKFNMLMLEINGDDGDDGDVFLKLFFIIRKGKEIEELIKDILPEYLINEGQNLLNEYLKEFYHRINGKKYKKGIGYN